MHEDFEQWQRIQLNYFFCAAICFEMFVVYTHIMSKHICCMNLISVPGVLGKLQTDAEDVVVDLQVRGCHEASKELGEKVETLAEFLNKIRTIISENGNLKKDEVKEELVEELECIIQQGLAHKTGMQEAIQTGRLTRAGHKA